MFFNLDLRVEYHQVGMKRGEEYKTDFRTHHRLWEFKVMPFGLTIAPTVFQSLMNEVFKDQMRKVILVFFDDILIFNKTMEDHIKQLEIVWKLLKNNQLFMKMGKYEFGQSQIEYLGYIINCEGVSTDQSKVSSMVDWPLPKTDKELRGFLGLIGYYRKYMLN